VYSLDKFSLNVLSSREHVNNVRHFFPKREVNLFCTHLFNAYLGVNFVPFINRKNSSSTNRQKKHMHIFPNGVDLFCTHVFNAYLGVNFVLFITRKNSSTNRQKKHMHKIK